jgi:acyl-coenzyme A synthetase/AMP-(fatty) acid ligase
MRNGRLRPRRRTAWLETGDLVERHGEGFRFAARRRDGFKCSGQWVFPQRLEEALLRIPGVDLSAAVPVETAEGLTRLRAYVVLSGLERRDSEAWLQRADACMRQLRPKALAPESIRIVDSLPVTRTGKLLRRQLEQC